MDNKKNRACIADNEIAMQQCQCKAQAKLACYMQSNGACPKPEDNVR